MSEEMKNEKVQETMEDFAAELEASYKEYDEKRSQAYVADETPDAEKWQEVKQLQADHAVVNVKIKEIVKGGAVAYLDELRAFIPASQLSLEYGSSILLRGNDPGRVLRQKGVSIYEGLRCLQNSGKNLCSALPVRHPALRPGK